MSRTKPKGAPGPSAPPDRHLKTERIEFERIVVGKQIRIFFGDITDLASKIDASDWVDPLVVRPLDDKKERYQLICGERRYKAIRLLRKTDRDNNLPPRHDLVDAQIFEGSDLGAMLLNAHENLGRKDLTHYELALYIEELGKHHHLKHERIAQELGLSPGHVSKVASILKLDAVILEQLKKGKQIPLNQMAAWTRLRPEQQRQEYNQWLGLEQQPSTETNRKTKRKMLPYRKAEGLLSALEQAKADRMTLAAVRYLMGLRDKPPLQLVETPKDTPPAPEIPPSDPMGD